MLARALGNAAAEVIEVLDDSRLKIKKELNKKVTEGLKLKPEGSTYKVSIHLIQIVDYRVQITFTELEIRGEIRS